MVEKWAGNYFDGKSAVSKKVEIQHVSEGILIEFADGRMRIWHNYEFRLKQDRLKGPIRLEYGEFTPEIIEVEDPSFQKGIIEKNFKRPRYLSIWLALFAILLIPSIFYLGIPAASEWFVRFVPISIEEKLGDYVVNELFPDRQICQAEAGRKALDEMVMRLIPKESKYNFKIEVVDSDLVNAIAFPGGNILIFRGLLEISPSADGFAGVLAHEMQHVLHRHGTLNILRQTALSGIFKLLYGDAGSFAKTFFDTAKIITDNWQTVRSEILINCHDEHPSTDVVFALAYRLLDPTQQHLVNYDWFKFIHNKNAIQGLSRIRNHNDYLLTHKNHEKIYVGEKRVSRVFHYHDKELDV